MQEEMAIVRFYRAIIPDGILKTSTFQKNNMVLRQFEMHPFCTDRGEFLKVNKKILRKAES
ncbi:hypothetical protein FACS189430_02510 [Bacteroidia bacterium]|nr:hypothetical protein FACS189430_02510 [Bacteroidia bacterium]